jgi:hypothetical protein
MEHAVVMNVTKSHIGGDEDCPQRCGHRVKLLEKKVTQILMEIFVEKEWIWWSKTGKMVTTASDRTALVLGDGQAAMEDVLHVWEAPSRAGEVELPAAGGSSGLLS